MSAFNPVSQGAAIALGVARTGARVAGGVARRNPSLALVAAAIGVGYLAYTAYRKHVTTVAAQAHAEPKNMPPIDSTATVVETRKRGTSVSGSRREAASTVAAANDDAVKPGPKPTAKRARKRSPTA